MNNIESNKGTRIADGLKKVLASSYTLYLKTQNFHWNVEGPQFHSLHTMFEEQYTELAAAVDELAERIRALGVYAPGSYQSFAKLSVVDEVPETVLSAQDMLDHLIKSHQALLVVLEETREAAEEIGDEVTVDMMIGRSTIHEKTIWMLKSTRG